MKRLLPVAVLSLIATLAMNITQAEEKAPPALDFTMKSLDGKKVKLGDYQGKVLLVVNVASECGLTPQYEELQELHKK